MKKILILSGICLLFVSCASTPKIETFILDGDVQQDFIRPSILSDKMLDCEMDFTVRSEKQGITQVVVNFSLSKGKEALFPLDEASFIADSGEPLALSGIKPLFIDRIGSVSRYGATLSPDQFKLLIQQEKPVFRVVLKAKAFDLLPGPWFIKQLRGAETQYIY